MNSDDRLYRNLVNRWKEVVEVPPQNLGILTPLYKHFMAKVKAAPWSYLFIAGIATGMGIYAIFGPSVSRLVSILQRGF